MTGWFLVVSVVGLSLGDTSPPLDDYSAYSRWAVPFESAAECREFLDRAAPVVEFGSTTVGVFWACWENPPPLLGGDDG